MAEPLTKDKLYCGCGLGSCTDGNLITVKDLKSALEYLSKEICDYSDDQAIACLPLRKLVMKAFPAIYKNED